MEKSSGWRREGRCCTWEVRSCGESSHGTHTTQAGLCWGAVGKAPSDAGLSPSLVRRACRLSSGEQDVSTQMFCSCTWQGSGTLLSRRAYGEARQLSSCVWTAAVLGCRPRLARLCCFVDPSVNLGFCHSLKPRGCAEHLRRWRTRSPQGFFPPIIKVECSSSDCRWLDAVKSCRSYPWKHWERQPRTSHRPCPLTLLLCLHTCLYTLCHLLLWLPSIFWFSSRPNIHNTVTM